MFVREYDITTLAKSYLSCNDNLNIGCIFKISFNLFFNFINSTLKNNFAIYVNYN